MSAIVDAPDAVQATPAPLTPEAIAAKLKDEATKGLGLAPEAVESIKKQFGKVEATSIGGRWFAYRTLRRSELKQIRQNMQGGDDLTQEEKISARCLVFPKLSEMELREEEAGLATTLCELIYHFSGYSPDIQPVKL